MRKISLAVAVLGVCLAWSFLPHAPAVGQDESALLGGADGGPAGQTPFAGTFLAEIDFGPLGMLPAVFQIHADGTGWSTDASDQGVGGILDLDSPHLASWTRTGPFETRIVGLFLNFDSASGAPTTVTRITHVLDWDVGFDTVSAVATLRLYDTSMGEDPLDPEGGTPGPIVPWTARRLVP